MHPTKTDRRMLAALDKGPATAEKVAQLAETSKWYTLARLKKMTDAGLLTVCHNKDLCFSGGSLPSVWARVPGIVLEPWRSQTGPKGEHPEKMDPIETPTQVRESGYIPANLPPPTLAGLVAQMTGPSRS